MSERLGRVRRVAPETPAGDLDAELARRPPHVATRIATLADRYGVRFEATCNASTALFNYEYLDLLDGAHDAWRLAPPRPATLHDAGCGSFAYAAALAAFFRPARLIGVELEGYRRLRDGANRHERALGYLASLPGAEFRVADYATIVERAELVTAFFPFVTPGPVLAWRLPLRVLRPAALYGRIAANLRPDGRFLTVNLHDREAQVADAYAQAAGLRCLARHARTRLIHADRPPVVVSLWCADATRGTMDAVPVEPPEAP